MLKRIISAVLVLTMAISVLPLDAQAVVNSEIKDAVQSLTEVFDSISKMLPEESELTPEASQISEAAAPEDFMAHNPVSMSDNTFNYVIAPDGAYITFDKLNGSITEFCPATSEGALGIYDIDIPAEIEHVGCEHWQKCFLLGKRRNFRAYPGNHYQYRRMRIHLML